MTDAAVPPPPDYRSRRTRLLAAAQARGANAAVVSDPTDMRYLTGYGTNLYSRPIRLLVGPTSSVLVVPDLEGTQAGETADVDDVLVYSEVPDRGPTEHVLLVKEGLRRSGAGAVVGVDLATCPLGLGAQLAGAGRSWVDVGDDLRTMRLIKDVFEVAAIRRAGRLVKVGVDRSLEAARRGISEIELDGVGDEAMQRYAARHWPDSAMESWVMSPSGSSRTLRPHTHSTGRAMRSGDVLIHSRQVVLDGYRAEYERTVVVDGATGPQQRALDAATEAQAAALAQVRPGVSASQVNAAAVAAFTSAGYGDSVLHRTGHGVGLSFHEGPSLDFRNELVLEAGMCMTIEPGIYVEGLGGFRHSHSVLVTDRGHDVLTG